MSLIIVFLLSICHCLAPFARCEIPHGINIGSPFMEWQSLDLVGIPINFLQHLARINLLLLKLVVLSNGGFLLQICRCQITLLKGQGYYTLISSFFVLVLLSSSCFPTSSFKDSMCLAY